MVNTFLFSVLLIQQYFCCVYAEILLVHCKQAAVLKSA